MESHGQMEVGALHGAASLALMESHGQKKLLALLESHGQLEMGALHGLALMESHGQKQLHGAEGFSLMESHGQKKGALHGAEGLALKLSPGKREVGALHGTEAVGQPMVGWWQRAGAPVQTPYHLFAPGECPNGLGGVGERTCDRKA